MQNFNRRLNHLTAGQTNTRPYGAYPASSPEMPRPAFSPAASVTLLLTFLFLLAVPACKSSALTLTVGNGGPDSTVEHGLYPYEKDGRWGFLSADGQTAIEPAYKDAGWFSGRLAPVKDDRNRWALVDRQGKLITGFDYWLMDAPAGGRSWFLDTDTRWGFVDAYGQRLKVELESADTRLEYVEPFSAGYAVVMYEGRFGYIDRDGHTVCPPAFDYAGAFNEGRAVISQGAKYSLIDDRCRLYSLPGNPHGRLANGLVAVEKDHRYGYVNRAGQWVLKPAWHDARPFSEQLAAVLDSDGWKYINSLGQIIISLPEADYAYPFKGGHAVFVRGGRFGLVNVKGEETVKPAFNYLGSLDGRLWVVQHEGYWGYITSDGRRVYTGSEFDDQ